MGSDQRTRADEAALDQWLAEHPDHRADYAAHAALWDEIGALADDPDAYAVLRGTREAPVTGRLWQRRSVLYGLVGAATAASAATILLSGREGYATRPGEQRRVALADGSVVTLDTDSAIEVRIGGIERRIVLKSGQAFFEVAPDPARPFRVLDGRHEIRALGTAFSVRRDAASARIFLMHGSIAIREPDAPELVLKPGEEAWLAVGTPPHVIKVDPERAQAWRFGRLIFDAMPLGEAVAEVNRYGGRQIALADSTLGRLKVSGIFHVGQPEAFVESMAAVLPLRVTRETAGTITLGPR